MDEQSFEHSLKHLLSQEGCPEQSGQVLDRALKKASRQTAAGALFVLFARTLEAVMLGLSTGAAASVERAGGARQNSVAEKENPDAT